MGITKKTLEFYRGIEGHCFPLDGKIPALKGNWRKRKFTKSQLMDFVSRGYNLGYALGKFIVVIDVDPRNGGMESLKKLRDKTGLKDLSNYYPTVMTGGGGFHYYCILPISIRPGDLRSNHKNYPGIDIKKHGGYVVIAGSTHPDTGTEYQFDTSSPLKPGKKLPEIDPGIAEIFTKRLKKAINGSGQTISKKTLKRILKKLPIENYNTNDLWYPILAASHNATGGKGLEEFLTWSLSDPKFASDRNLIETRWNSLKSKSNSITLNTLLREALRYDSLQSITSKHEVKKAFDDNVSIAGKKKKKKAKEIVPSELRNDVPHIIARNVLRKRFKSGNHIMHGMDLRYWIYNGLYWENIQSNMIERYLYEESLDYKIKHPGFRGSINSLFKSAETILRAMVASERDLFKLSIENTIINTLNCELWLDNETGKITRKKHNPDSCLTYCLDTKYRKKADCPRFKRALMEIFSYQADKEDVIRHLMEVIGYTIQAKKNIATWVLFFGKGSNGKTVILQVISALLGESALEKSIDEFNTGRNNHALASLPGKLAVIDEDVTANATLPDGMIKKISENKNLTANPKGASEFRFRNSAIPLLAANNWPNTKDLSEGLRRRALIFPFMREFSPEESDIGLTDYIVENELAGVLNLALEGLQRLRERGRFELPKSCTSAKDQWFLSNSQIHQFLEDCFVKHANKRLPFSVVWGAYNVWCHDNGIRMNMAKHRLKNVLSDIGAKLGYSPSKRLYLLGYTKPKRKKT